MAGKTYTNFAVTRPREWVAHVEINRPTKRNAFLEEMRFELRDIFDSLSVDPSVRAIVFSGAGDKAFSAGLDVVSANKEGTMFNPRPEDTIDAARHAVAVRRWAQDFQDCVTSIERCEKPVICVLHGYAFGIAVDLACCADIRIAAQDAVFSVKEVDLGIAADLSSLTRLPKIVRSYGWVKEVSLTARVFDAAEALEERFVNKVLPTKAKALEEGLNLASLISEKSPVAVQGTKNFLDFSRDHTVEDGLKYTAVWNSAALQTKDIPVSFQALLGKKRATYEKL
ncbi:hypothetical protein ASPVEDRAFT_80458 [Aspergillus versicolor CBS 583.65]|uniref:Enoyl-CoA hydratase n=1 Tax=Aspergillus versicolor CBS 583.65 TaxID=1036611 RepID=A0A1L9PBE4_ASPVE|nr:uncharacterized protein ASPVEDRAFT_80458 [Aspergillus versicolor CBS 583.65]OJI98828.1 hypothetical protein ASPVEDRAFT_80458 [Aspergillus versicolor CBS 583.65]